jgi:hypothetical protein
MTENGITSPNYISLFTTGGLTTTGPIWIPLLTRETTFRVAHAKHTHHLTAARCTVHGVANHRSAAHLYYHSVALQVIILSPYRSTLCRPTGQQVLSWHWLHHSLMFHETDCIWLILSTRTELYSRILLLVTLVIHCNVNGLGRCCCGVIFTLGYTLQCEWIRSVLLWCKIHTWLYIAMWMD